MKSIGLEPYACLIPLVRNLAKGHLHWVDLSEVVVSIQIGDERMALPKFNTPVSEAMRALAQKNVAQTRELYEHSKHALEAALETLERSFDAVGQGATALNRKVMDIAQCNIDSGFDLAKNLAGAKNLAEVIELQAAYWRKQFDTLTSSS